MMSPVARRGAGAERATSSSSHIVQRSCACGGSAGMTGECEGCKRNKLLGHPLQTKLAISKPGDEYEREADRVAEQVMRMPGVGTTSSRGPASPIVQRRLSGESPMLNRTAGEESAPVGEQPVSDGGAAKDGAADEGGSRCPSWRADPQSISKRAGEFYARNHLTPPSQATVERIECEPPIANGNYGCYVHFSDGLVLRVIVRDTDIVVGVPPISTMHPPPSTPLCFYEYSCPEGELVLTVKKCQSSKPSGSPGPPAVAQRAAASGSEGPAAAPAAVHDVLASPGRPLDRATRSLFESRFGYDFGHVRIHADPKAAESAQAVNALAYTVGSHVVFRSGQFDPHSHAGQRLLAHELTHVVQQASTIRPVGTISGLSQIQEVGSPFLQRTPKEEELAKRSAAEIMNDQDYMDNNMKSIEFYQAELAIVHYQDGSTLRLGLVPEWIEAPIEGVDYRTSPEQHLSVATETPATFKFIPRGREAVVPPSATFKEFLDLTTQTVQFRVEAKSGKIVPTEVNALTAPNLCTILNDAEAQYVKSFDAMAEGAVQTLEKLGLIVTLASVLTAGGAVGGTAKEAGKRGAAGAAAGRAGTSVAAAAEAQLTSKFASLLKTGAVETMTIEGVTFTNVRVALKGGELLVRRLGIQNVSRIAGQGRLVHAGFEQAAIAAARAAGATSTRVALETVVNQSWRSYLVTRGYAPYLVEKVGAKGFEVLLAKVFTL